MVTWATSMSVKVKPKTRGPAGIMPTRYAYKVPDHGLLCVHCASATGVYATGDREAMQDAVVPKPGLMCEDCGQELAAYPIPHMFIPKH